MTSRRVKQRGRGRLIPVLLMMLSPLAAARAQKIGIEFQVNLTTVGGQTMPKAAAASDGDFVVVWEDVSAGDGSGSGVFGARFGADGGAKAPEFQANAYTEGNQNFAALDVSRDGDFVVVWTSAAQDGSLGGIFARRFNSLGVAQGSEIPINSTTTGNQFNPDVALTDINGFVVVWSGNGQDGSGYGIFARRFDDVGNGLGFEFQVNQYTTSDQFGPAIALGGNATYLVTWSSVSQDGFGDGVFARSLGVFGLPSSAEFPVNTYTSGAQDTPSVAADADGGFVVAWTSALQDGSGDGVFGRRFDSLGAALGGEFQVNSHTGDQQKDSSVAGDGTGRFLVAWTSDEQESFDDGVFAQRFGPQGRVGVEFQVNTFTENFQDHATVAGSAGGSFVIAWLSAGASQQDGDGNGVFAQRFASSFAIDVDGDGTALPLSDGILILRHLFGFTGAVLVDGAVNMNGCTRCTVQEIQPFLDGLF